MTTRSRRPAIATLLGPCLLLANPAARAETPAAADDALQSSDQQLTPRHYVLATATSGGTFYPVGRALATLVNAQLKTGQRVSMEAIESAGSGENIKLLRNNKAQFAILGGLYGAWAWHGAGAEKRAGPQRELRSVTMLWQDVNHIIVSSDRVSSGTASDLTALAGHKFAIGERNSGSAASGEHILRALGINPGSMQLKHLSYGSAAEALLAGTIEGMNVPGGLPVAAAQHVFEVLGEQVTLLNFTQQQLSAINKHYKLWTPYVIPKGTYPGQTQAVNSIAEPNFLAVRADVDDDVVYMMTQAIYANIPFLNSQHEATVGLRVSDATGGLPVPLHPGALRFYKERGIEVPAELIAP